MKTGRVKFFNLDKGYGFIIDDDTNSDVFFHATGVMGTVEQDDQVEFEIETGKRGKKAVNVKKV